MDIKIKREPTLAYLNHLVIWDGNGVYALYHTVLNWRAWKKELTFQSVEQSLIHHRIVTYLYREMLEELL